MWTTVALESSRTVQPLLTGSTEQGGWNQRTQLLCELLPAGCWADAEQRLGPDPRLNPDQHTLVLHFQAGLPASRALICSLLLAHTDPLQTSSELRPRSQQHTQGYQAPNQQGLARHFRRSQTGSDAAAEVCSHIWTERDWMEAGSSSKLRLHHRQDVDVGDGDHLNLFLSSAWDRPPRTPHPAPPKPSSHTHSNH